MYSQPYRQGRAIRRQREGDVGLAIALVNHKAGAGGAAPNPEAPRQAARSIEGVAPGVVYHSSNVNHNVAMCS